MQAALPIRSAPSCLCPTPCRAPTASAARIPAPLGRCYIAHAAIADLAKEGKMTGKDVARAIKQYKIDVEKRIRLGFDYA